MPPNRFESEVESFLEGSHGDRTHIKRADHPRLHHYAGRYLMGALRYKTHPAHTPVHPNRYKTRPAHTLACSNRYKTRHTLQKSPILAHFRHAGRKLSRFSQSQPQQGEFSLVVSVSDQSKATCGAPPAAGFSHGARPPHGDHLLCPRKAHADTHTARISTMSHGDWDAAKEISPLLEIAPVGMKY